MASALLFANELGFQPASPPYLLGVSVLAFLGIVAGAVGLGRLIARAFGESGARN